METWIIYAIFSMIFAGLTSVLAKFGLQNIHPDLGLGIRTSVIFIQIALVNFYGTKYKDFALLTKKQLILLICSGLTTTLSWLFYYRAMKDGLVSYVASIDKASIVITLLLSFWLLGEAYRSGQLTIEQYAHYTKKYGLKSVVNLRGDSKKQWYREEMQAARENNLSHFDYDLSAYQHLKISEMHEILDILRKAPKPVLIHCQAGSDRTGLVSAVYLLALKGHAPDSAGAELSLLYGQLPFWGNKTIAMDNSWRDFIFHAVRSPQQD
jgi:transporter family protein